MTVKDLIKMLEQCHPDHKVGIGCERDGDPHPILGALPWTDGFVRLSSNPELYWDQDSQSFEPIGAPDV